MPGCTVVMQLIFSMMRARVSECEHSAIILLKHYIYAQQNIFTASTTILLWSNQVEQCKACNPKMIQHGKDLAEAKVLATEKAEEEGLQYVNG